MWHSFLQYIRPLYHGALSHLGALWYRYPSKDMRVVGVTGTKGKSTVVQMIVSLARTEGWTVGFSSSISFSDGQTDEVNTIRNSMPGRFRLHRLMAEARANGCELFVMEATSEGLVQNRHRGVQIDGGVFTNLYPEHLEAHGSFEAYKAAKGRLFTALAKDRSKQRDGFQQTAFEVLNGDSEYASYYSGLTSVPATVTGLSESVELDVRGEILEEATHHTTMRIYRGHESITELRLPLAGEFNVQNALVAFGVGERLGLQTNTMKNALEGLESVPGRMEQVHDNPRIIVDYAHIPDALEAVYSELQDRWQNEGERIIAVLGACGGGRDRWKRRPMGNIAGRYADYVIITNEDPYDEDKQHIIDEVFAGVMETNHTEGETAFRVQDRRDAFRKALAVSDTNDIIIITGKGSEESIVENGEKHPFNDKREIQRLVTGDDR
jgi:UDP-N-acetylmuramoyl-L-alanyl-D-glutamate--2,6-diaminopimelate ligase